MAYQSKTPSSTPVSSIGNKQTHFHMLHMAELQQSFIASQPACLNDCSMVEQTMQILDHLLLLAQQKHCM